MTSPSATITADAEADDLPFSSRTRTRIGVAVFALLAYAPVLLTDVGKVVSDSKSYLYIDPSRFLANVSSIWNSQIAMGTVDHQVLGYLFPLGPIYWVLEELLGLPPWIAERLWLGTLIFVAGLGMRYLLRALDVRGAGVPVGMLAYAFTPYVLQFATQQSVLLTPWAALPWMTAFVVLGLRRGGWKYPALFAITVQLAGSVNAASLAFVLLAPALWIPYSVLVVREANWRRAWATVWRTGVLTLAASLWWLSGLIVESGYGLDILRFTETLKTTAATTSPLEVLRGLGYWYFYGKDGVSLWNAAMPHFTQNPGVIFVSLFLPALALFAAVAVRWRHRAFFVLLVVIGVAIAVGAAPYDDPSPIAAAFQSFAGGSTVGLALRNADRAVPVIVLGIAVLLGAFVSALDQRLRERGLRLTGIVVAGVVCALCLANAPGVWGGSYYSNYLEWRSIPSYWRQAVKTVDAQPHDTRVLALPGSSFAAYRWGDVLDPIEPGLTTRPYVTRQQTPVGSEATAALLQAVDGRLQSNLLDPNALAPLARLMGVGDVLLDMDLQTDRYGLIPPGSLWNSFTERKPVGLGTPQTFGPKVRTLADKLSDVARPPTAPPPAVAVLSVDHPLPIVRTASAADPLVIDGDSEGLVDAATMGLLDPRRLVLYSQSYEREPDTMRALPPGASLVVTDSNRRRGRLTSFLNTYGPTLQAGEQPFVKDPHNQPFDVFPNATDASQTVTIMRGVKNVQATSGNQPFSLMVNRPSLALDGDLKTYWVVDGSVPVGPEVLRITFDKPITTDRVNLVQPVGKGQGRWITRATLRFDGGDAVHTDLGRSSRRKSGQTVQFSRQTFSTLEIRIDRVHNEIKPLPQNPVGFAEVRVADEASGGHGLRARENTRMPVDLLDALGKGSNDHGLVFVTSRDGMDDAAMRRQFTLPAARSFTVSGTAQLGAGSTDGILDRRLGLRDASAGGISITSSRRLNDPIARASSAIDGDLATAWNLPLGGARGFIKLSLPHAISFDHMNLHLVDDGRHSMPTRLRIQSDEGSKQVVDLTTFLHTPDKGGTVSVPIDFDAVHGRKFTFTITDAKPRMVRTSQKQKGLLLPSGIAELGIPGVVRQPVPAQLPSACINDLLTIDGKPFPVRVTGPSDGALKEETLTVAPCHARDPLTLAAGTHEIEAAETPHSPSGLDVSHIVLASAAGGTAATPARAVSTALLDRASAPPVHVVHQDNTSVKLRVDSASKPFWLVFGESYNHGWTAKAEGHDLGKPSLVNGYANGWLVHPDASCKPMTISLEWTPQRVVRAAIPLSALAFALCLGIAGVAITRDRRRRAQTVCAPPTLRRTWLPRPLDPKRGTVIATVLATAVVAALLAAPAIGVVVGVLVLLAILRPRWHGALRLAPALIVGVTAVYVTLAQIVNGYLPVFQWPTYFGAARIPVWIALLLLGADALIAIVWRTDFDEDESHAGSE